MIELWINNIRIDTDESVPFPITYSQADAKEPEKRKRTTSKTIELPGTQNNNRFFSSTYDLHLTNANNTLIGFDYDPTLRYPARVVENGEVTFNGSSNLVKVVRKKGVNRFHVVLFTEIVDIFQSLGDLLVSELDWSDYDHVLSIANIQSSWSAPVGSGYLYGLVHYGYTTNLLNYKTNELYPLIYIKEFVEKCFALSSKTVDSNFLSTDPIQNAVWGWGGGDQVTIDSTEASNRQASYTGDGIASYSLPHTSYEPIAEKVEWNSTNWIVISDNAVVTMTLVTDTYAQYDESTGEFTAVNGGNYNLNIEGSFTLDYALTDLGLVDTQYVIKVTFEIYKNDALISQTTFLVNESTAGSAVIAPNINQALELDAGDVITSVIKIVTNGTQCFDIGGVGEELTVDFDLNNDLVYNFTAINSALVDGDTVKLSRMLPTMKCADLLKDIMIMGNLYMRDPDEDGVVVMEPIDSYFFETDDTDNWSDILDRDSEIEIESASTIEGKVYRFRWAEDRDYFKLKYFEKFGHDYGDYDYNVPSTFKTGEKLFQLKQAQTCPVSIDGTDIIIPMIVNRSESGVDTPYKGKPRIYLYNGLKSCDDWTLENSDTGALTTNTQYPQLHHLDDLTTATFDLNFGVPKAVFYPATTYTTDNLFSTYIISTIRELTDRAGKIVNASFWLKSSDLYTNFMRRLVNIDGVLYRKNIVHDYYAGQTTLTRVELIKVLRARSSRRFAVSTPEVLAPPSSPTRPVANGTTKLPNNQTRISADTSSGDAIILIDSAVNYRDGLTWQIKKTAAANKVEIRGANIDGSSRSQYLFNQNDSITITYIAGEFYTIGKCNDIQRLSLTSGINAKTVGTTNLFTVPTGYTAIITKAIARCSVATAITAALKAGIGVAAGEDDLFASRNMTGFTRANNVYLFDVSGNYIVVAAGSTIKLGIDNGSTGTTHTISVELFGYLV